MSVLWTCHYLLTHVTWEWLTDDSPVCRYILPTPPENDRQPTHLCVSLLTYTRHLKMTDSRLTCVSLLTYTRHLRMTDSRLTSVCHYLLTHVTWEWPTDDSPVCRYLLTHRRLTCVRHMLHCSINMLPCSSARRLHGKPERTWRPSTFWLTRNFSRPTTTASTGSFHNTVQLTLPQSVCLLSAWLIDWFTRICQMPAWLQPITLSWPSCTDSNVM